MGTNVEATFDQLRGILDAEDFGSWSNDDANILLSLLDQYHKQKCKLQTSRTRNPGGKEGEAERQDEDDETVIGEVDRSLTKLRHFLQERLPYGTIAEPKVPHSSTLASPVQCGADPVAGKGEVRPPTFSVDAFMYLEEDIEELVQRGCIAREYCRTCGSIAIGLCDYITHSFSQDQLVYISCYLIPSLSDASYVFTTDLCLRRREKHILNANAPFTCQHVVDVGSRLGVVLLSCYFAAHQQRLKTTRRVTGVEIDDKLIGLQHDAIARFATRPTLLQLDLVHSSCLEGAGAEVLREADVIILHNVFEYFISSTVEHLKCWRRLREILARRGQLLICCPSLEETFASFTEDDVHGMTKGDRTAGGPVSQQGEVEFNRKRQREGEKKKDGGVVESWCRSWVEEIDVAEVREAFLAYRHGNYSCRDAHSSCDGEMDEELTERIQSVRVYMVK
ncbi:hypothetical protein TCDM_10369 [Trypanosoma cruzi Dm28c]|uniref:Methyltransferase type 11 domain-containing protein n=2 Tax=Trypanosoma cruzi TaxID=5693 RepID=V5B315_TRYCR|nr:hypothetical protein TCDM_10369 [Trypanosoma cruzi Dm28c]PBJ70134.1 hypothetical protein BCY84_18544 [Trypanosoma cruzi cruzi]PWV01365.1 hypothetical protein C4B63_4g494 [Trypanosoma cruzi]